MKVELKGVRGSIPTTGADTSYYGGNTSCTVVSEDGALIILDGGSGLQKVKLPDNNIKRVDILLTHLRLDHIQGLGYFGPLFDPSMDVHIWAPKSATQSLHARLGRYLSPPLFPVLIRDLPAKLTLHDVENGGFDVGPFRIESRYIIHPGPTVGYRITGQRGVLAYIPDHEPALGLKGLTSDTKWISGFDIVSGADLLLHDAQYTREEYKTKIGWGHSCIDDTIQFATLCRVKRLLLTHHDPTHDDARLNEIFNQVRQIGGYTFQLDLAKEGMEIELS